MAFKSKFLYLFIGGIILITGCGGGGGNDGEIPTAAAIEPDSAYTGNNCSCGGKTSEGSGMTLSVSKPMFPGLTEKKYVPGEVLVKFRNGTSQAKAAQIMNSFGNRGVKSLFTAGGIKNSLLKKVKLKEDMSVEQAVNEYKNQPEVEYAEPNYIYKALTTSPNDPNYSSSWGLNNTGQEVNGVTGTLGIDIDAETAWDDVIDCSGVIVAVLDTGINYNQRDLSSNMWDGGTTYPNHGYDFVDEDNDPMDLNGHGTHCAGIIGAKGNDSTGLAGICWGVKLMAIRALDAAGSGTLEGIAQGINYAVDNGAHIISASLGGSAAETFEDAVEYAETNGVIIVAAAGNDGTNVTTYAYPAAYGYTPYNYTNVISVAAADQDGNLADFSNYGSWVDIAAPGVNILSTWPGQSVITTETFDNWKKEKGWGTGTYTYTGSEGNVDLKMLTNPSNFRSNTYSSDLQSLAYIKFDLNAYDAVSAVASFYADLNLEDDYDYLCLMYNVNGSKPDINDEDAYLAGYTGGTHGSLGYAGEFNLTSLITHNISLGFLLYSDYSVQYYGAGIALFNMQRLYLNTTACMYADGTSMAAPHVAGVAAMCVQRYIDNEGSYSKTSNYLQMVNAVFDGASTYTSFGGNVVSNRMLNAPGALDEVDSL